VTFKTYDYDFGRAFDATADRDITFTPTASIGTPSDPVVIGYTARGLMGDVNLDGMVNITDVSLMVNYILTRHDYPMIVVRSRKKKEYLEALHRTDLTVGAAPSLGAHASKRDIQQFLTYFTNLFIDEVSYDIQFLTERGDNVWWFDGERVKFRSATTSIILNRMYEQPNSTIPQLAEAAGISLTAVNKQLRLLTDKGYIARTEKDNSWRLIITPSV
jgi:Fic family protein